MRTLALAALAVFLTACAEDPALRAFDRAAAMGLAVERPSGPCVRINDNAWTGTRITEVRC